jgi:hypothetical protein
MKKYLTVFVPFIAIIAALIFFLASSASDSENNFRWLIYFYFVITTLIFHIGYVRTSRSRPQVFVRYYMASTTIKLLMHIAIIVIFCITHKEMAVKFIISFMIMYFVFTAFELIAVGRKKIS